MDRFGASVDCVVCGDTCSQIDMRTCEECGIDMCVECLEEHECEEDY